MSATTETGPATAPVESERGCGGELAAPELAAWRGLLRAHTHLVKELDAELEQAHGMPLSSYEVLIFLEAAPGHRLRMADLADRVLLSRSGMTRLVDRLETLGLLERHKCSADARGYWAVLTGPGLEFLDRARPTHLAGVRERFLQHFSSEELERLAEYWDRVLPGASGSGCPGRRS